MNSVHKARDLHRPRSSHRPARGGEGNPFTKGSLPVNGHQDADDPIPAVPNIEYLSSTGAPGICNPCAGRQRREKKKTTREKFVSVSKTYRQVI